MKDQNASSRRKFLQKLGLSAAGVATGLPLLGVHHLEGHALSPLMHRELEFPFLSMVVSGGHSSLLQVDDRLEITLLGQTLDDAAGEVFDKVARLRADAAGCFLMGAHWSNRPMSATVETLSPVSAAPTDPVTPRASAMSSLTEKLSVAVPASPLRERRVASEASITSNIAAISVAAPITPNRQRRCCAVPIGSRSKANTTTAPKAATVSRLTTPKLMRPT